MNRAGRAAVARLPLTTDLPADPGVRMVFTGRRPPAGARHANLSLVVGGGDVAAARAAALALAGATPDDAVFMRQVHGGGVTVVGAADRGRGRGDHDAAVPDTDALVTFATDVALVVLVADCVPLLLADPGRGVAAVHAGRRGVQAGIVTAAVAVLAPDDPSRVVAVAGPAIGGCCYEVPADVAAAVAAGEPAAATTTTWGAAALDLPAAVRAQLRRAGVGDVRMPGPCTRCCADTYFSHRADTAPGGGPAGRQAGIVVRRASRCMSRRRLRRLGVVAGLDSPSPASETTGHMQR